MKEAMQNSRCRGRPAVLIFHRTTPIWQECHWAQLELAFHITLKFLDFREQPYKGGTDSTDKKRRTERQKVTEKNGDFYIPAHKGQDVSTNPIILEKLWLENIYPSCKPVLFPSISMWGELFFFLINLFLLPDLIFICFVFIFSYRYLFNFLLPFAALTMQADLFPAQSYFVLPTESPSTQSRTLHVRTLASARMYF